MNVLIEIKVYYCLINGTISVYSMGIFKIIQLNRRRGL